MTEITDKHRRAAEGHCSDGTDRASPWVIRDGLDSGTRRRIAGQAAKDVATVPDDELPLHLPRWLRLP